MIASSRILVVDDNPDVRLIVRIALRSNPALSVDEASGGFEAIAKIEEHCPDLVLLDLMMPDMDGFEVCRRVRARAQSARVPILMLTALADAKSRNQGFLAGADDYLVKPFRSAELRAHVQGLLLRAAPARLTSATVHGTPPQASGVDVGRS